MATYKDLTRAIHRINPAYEYRLNDAKTAIADWRHGDPQPSAAALQAADDANAADDAALATLKAADSTERDAILALDSQLEVYIALASPTAAQTAAVVKLVARAMRRVIKRVG